jgi:hypothetical protein
LKKGDLGGFRNCPGEGIYGKRYICSFFALGDKFLVSGKQSPAIMRLHEKITDNKPLRILPPETCQASTNMQNLTGTTHRGL